MVQKKSRAKNAGKTQISISLPLHLVSKIDRLAEEQNRNRSNFIATQLERLADDSLEVNEPKASFSKAKTKRK